MMKRVRRRGFTRPGWMRQRGEIDGPRRRSDEVIVVGFEIVPVTRRRIDEWIERWEARRVSVAAEATAVNAAADAIADAAAV